MAFNNFIPTLWAEGMMRELEKAHVFVKDCTTEFEGQLKQMGDKVKVPMLGGITITDRTLGQRNDDIPDPEVLSDAGREVMADHVSMFNFLVSDIDAVQSKYDIMAAAQRKAAYELADKHDKLVAGLAASAANQLFSTPQKAIEGKATEGEINVLRLIDLLAQRLYEANVPEKTKIVATIPPRLRTLIKAEYLDKDTGNSEMMGNGYIGKYGGVILRMSNNVYNSGTTSEPIDHIMCRTTDSISFVQQLSKVVAYQPEKKFSDAVKGMSLYGAQFLRPECVAVAKITY